MSEEVGDACWICLSSEGHLESVCACPSRFVHRHCVARWQLQSAGRSEEHQCRFCQAKLPGWKESLTPPNLQPAIPTVSVHYNGFHYKLKVKPGSEGLATFQKQLQCITGLPELDCLQIMFQCRAPETAEQLSFNGLSAFDAAIHCASISAAKRQVAESAASNAGPSTSQAHLIAPLDGSHLGGTRTRSMPEVREQGAGPSTAGAHGSATGRTVSGPPAAAPQAAADAAAGSREPGPGPVISKLKKVQGLIRDLFC